jgi:uncharacterized protein YjiS (DUF1127 family)
MRSPGQFKQEMSMRVVHYNFSAEPGASPGKLSVQSAHPLGRLAQRAWAAYWQWQLRRATVQLLYSLDDHLLRDLGIGRDEIHLYVHGTQPYAASREDRP